MTRWNNLRWLLLLVIVAVIETACGPIRSTAGLADAQKMLRAAENEQADKVALYEMTLARKYLDKAFEELGYNDYYEAERLAIEAEGYAQAALQKALGTELIDPQDAGPAIDEPDLEVIPEEGELAPDRRTGDEDVGDVVLEQEDEPVPPATTTPEETPAATTTPAETPQDPPPAETPPAEEADGEESSDAEEEPTPSNPWNR